MYKISDYSPCYGSQPLVVWPVSLQAYLINLILFMPRDCSREFFTTGDTGLQGWLHLSRNKFFLCDIPQEKLCNILLSAATSSLTVR